MKAPRKRSRAWALAALAGTAAALSLAGAASALPGDEGGECEPHDPLCEVIVVTPTPVPEPPPWEPDWSTSPEERPDTGLSRDAGRDANKKLDRTIDRLEERLARRAGPRWSGWESPSLECDEEYGWAERVQQERASGAELVGLLQSLRDRGWGSDYKWPWVWPSPRCTPLVA